MDRINQVNSLLQTELANLISEEIELPEGVLVTVTKVKTSRDLRHAQIWLSVLPEKKGPSTLLLITKRVGILRRELSKRISLKFLPALHFEIDSGQVEASAIENLLDSLKIDKS
tara:strand:+ start:558 stop:899 length:342 start_codon:yes stop_codon:yes gene_type:complete